MIPVGLLDAGTYNHRHIGNFIEHHGTAGASSTSRGIRGTSGEDEEGPRAAATTTRWLLGAVDPRSSGHCGYE